MINISLPPFICTYEVRNDLVYHVRVCMHGQDAYEIVSICSIYPQ